MTRLDLSATDCMRLIEGRAQELVNACTVRTLPLWREDAENIAREILALAAGLASRPAELDKAA